MQDAINAAVPPNQYTILVAQGTYAENLIINSSKTIWLQGGWKNNFTSRGDDSSITIIDGGEHNSVFDIQANSGANITIGIEGFTIRNGRAERGAGVHAVSFGANSYIGLTLHKNSVTSNNASIGGGGIWAEAFGNGAMTELVLISNVISGNMAWEGGGIAAQSCDGGHLIVTFIDNNISTNTATEFAGGVWLNSALENSTTVVTLTRNVISNNSGPNLDGGGIGAYASGAGANTTLLLKNNVIARNSAGYGGGFFGGAWGTGALLNVTLINNVIAENKASQMFGGLVVGPWENGLTYLTMANNVVTGNVADEHPAGGLHSGASAGSMSTVSLHNDILWGNVGSRGPNDLDMYSYSPSEGPVIVTARYSTIGSFSNYQANFTSVNSINSNPLFVDAVNLTFILKDESPAIDAGDPDTAYNDRRRPPGKGMERGDMGIYGGPGILDITSPASITNLRNISYTQNYINWTWNDPSDSDFLKVIIYIDGIIQTYLSNGIQFYNATGLTADSMHTLATRTMDTSGNINQSWVNLTATTQTPTPIITTLTIASPANGTTTHAPTITVTGTASDASDIASVTVNGLPATGTTSWNAEITLTEGENTITVVATDTSGNTATETVTVHYEPLRGDLNRDGILTSADAAIALMIAAGGSASCDPATLDAADVNRDGKVTSLDALMILQAAAGAITL
jgi:hypothetical protein